MIVECLPDGEDKFLIDLPWVLPVGSRIVYSGKTYEIDTYIYQESEGLIQVCLSESSMKRSEEDYRRFYFRRDFNRLSLLKYISDSEGISLREAKDMTDRLVEKWGL